MATQLTKEYFDKALKIALDNHSDDLKMFMRKEIKKELEDLARMVAHGFDDMGKRLDVVQRVERVEKFVYKLAESFGMRV